MYGIEKGVNDVDLYFGNKAEAGLPVIDVL